MIDLRAAVILLGSLTIAGIAVALRLADSATWPTALLTGGAAFCAACGLFVVLVKNSKEH